MLMKFPTKLKAIRIAEIAAESLFKRSKEEKFFVPPKMSINVYWNLRQSAFYIFWGFRVNILSIILTTNISLAPHQSILSVNKYSFTQVVQANPRTQWNWGYTFGLATVKRSATDRKESY